MNRSQKVAGPLVVILVLFAGTFSANSSGPGLSALKDSLPIFNLLKDLALRKSQAEAILEKARQAEAIRRQARVKIRSLQIEAMELLEALKKETGEEKTTNGSPEKRRLQEVKGAIEAVNLEARERVDRLTTSVEKTLQEFQLAVLDGFQPEPVRKTQPGGKRSELEIEALTRVLETIHQAPGLRYRTLRERMIERLLERLRAHGPAYNPANEVELRVYLRTTLDQVRMLTSDDFQLRKGAISRELKETLLQKSAECSRQEKIRHFLLSRPALAILEERLNRGSFP